MARLIEQRDRDIRIRFEAEVAHGKSPSRAVVIVAGRSGLKQGEVRKIVQTKPAARRVTQHQETRA